ncbi:MAG TPA: HEAT repeat domain-containing protein [Longilinea sp.]|nr:HEAT repeat domain-containing protein [Longilinea sp.]
MTLSSNPVSFDQVVEALLDEQHPFPATYLHSFSDISAKDLRTLKEIWEKVNADRRVSLLEDLEDIADADTLVSFDDIGKFALSEPDPRARVIATRILWENDDRKLIPALLDMLENDEDETVRAAAAAALGKYVYLGELEELPAEDIRQVEDMLLTVISGNDEKMVRCRALEALGFSSNEEVSELIKNAYDTDDPDWVVSALFAMSRTADDSWQPQVMKMLKSKDARVQLEAIRAAGELTLQDAREPLLDMLEDGIDDNELREATAWSLSKIGGENVREAIEKLLENAEEDEEAEFLETALDNLSFTEDYERMELFDFGTSEDEDDTDSIVGFDEDEEESDYADEDGEP